MIGMALLRAGVAASAISASVADGGPGGGGTPSDLRGADGVRNHLIVVTTTATLGGGTIDNLVNGDKLLNDVDNSCWMNSGQSGREIRFDFFEARLVTGGTWYQDNSTTHGTWKWQGSADGSIWVDIGAGFTFGGTAQSQTQLAGNIVAYRYYRLLQTAGTTSSSPWLREIEFVIDDGASIDPAYWWGLGTGDRTTEMSVSTTAIIGGSSGPLENIINGSWAVSTSGAYFWADAQTGRTLTFDFGTPRLIVEAFWYQHRVESHGTWKWQGSNDDVGYTDIGSTFTLGGARRTRHTQLNGNSTAYRYYRLTQTAGTTHVGPNIQEVVFKINA